MGKVKTSVEAKNRDSDRETLIIKQNGHHSVSMLAVRLTLSLCASGRSHKLTYRRLVKHHTRQHDMLTMCLK